MNSAEMQPKGQTDVIRLLQEGNSKCTPPTEPKVSRGEETEAESKGFHGFLTRLPLACQLTGEEEEQWQKVRSRDVLV